MGTITGALVSLGKLPSFIASLGMMGVCGALSLVLAKSTAIYIRNPLFSFFGERLDKSIDLPLMQYFSVPAFIAIVVFSVVWVMLYHTPFGRCIIAIGGNESGARLSGINTVYRKWMVYVVAGVLAAISGVTLAARLEAADSIVGVGWEFDAIAATILGGTTFAKGKGGIGGTVLGVFVIGVTRNGLNVIGVPSLWQRAIKPHEVLDQGETSEADIQEDIEFALIQMKAETLQKIDEALERLEEGAYGNCFECGDEISHQRLRALPFAVRCKECEEAREAALQRERWYSQRRGPSSLFLDTSS